MGGGCELKGKGRKVVAGVSGELEMPGGWTGRKTAGRGKLDGHPYGGMHSMAAEAAFLLPFVAVEGGGANC